MKPSKLPLKSLNNHQILIIKESWKIVYANPVQSGEAILFAFLSRYPQHQARYSTLTNTPLTELRGNDVMANHSVKIM